MRLEVPDTLTRTRKAVPAGPRRPVRLYVCGPTVYDAAHVGHARTYLYFDVARRWFDDRGIPVRHIMNITDFEDKITARASSLGVTWCELARREETRFRADMRALRLRPPHATPRASRFVPQIIRAIRRLERRQPLERRPNGWYYRGDPDPAGPNFEVGAELARHAVLEPGHPFPPGPAAARDFLVWKPQEKPAPSWPSPWGPGMPGWHLECFVMADEYLSLPVDLHGGGTDLIYPHHYAENEVAFALRRRPFSRVFLHTAFVTAGGEKMSKSSGNLVPVREALDEFGADALRWFLLGRPVSQTVEWSSTGVERAREEHARLRGDLRGFREDGTSGSLPVAGLARAVDTISSAVADGFRVDAAFHALRVYVADAARSPNPHYARGDGPTARALLRRAERLLGLSLL